MRYLQQLLDTAKTPQTARLHHRPEQVTNSAGGYAWAVDKWTRLERFLILGSEGGTYYIGERELSLENAVALRECLEADGLRVVRTLRDVSAAGRAPKSDPALFSLALASSPKFADPQTNAAALQALPEIARTGRHLCNFAAFAEKTRGWGRGLRSAVAHWYLAKPVAELAYQLMKYQHRGRWSHRDLLRLSHPQAETPSTRCSNGPWTANSATGRLRTFGPANCASSRHSSWPGKREASARSFTWSKTTA